MRLFEQMNWMEDEKIVIPTDFETRMFKKVRKDLSEELGPKKLKTKTRNGKKCEGKKRQLPHCLYRKRYKGIRIK
jgi:hypothetical protein